MPSAADVPVFLIVRDEVDRGVGCGGLRPLEDAVLGRHVAEVKRMYVAEGSRGRGFSTAILRALEDEARALGMERLVLETGLEQPDAIRFYVREGYESIPLFGHYVGSELSVCFGRDLRI